MTGADDESVEQWRIWALPLVSDATDELVEYARGLAFDDLLRQVIAEQIDPDTSTMSLQDVRRALQEFRAHDDPEAKVDSSELLKLWRDWARARVSWPGRPVPEDPLFYDEVMQRIIAVRVEAGNRARPQT